MKNFLSKKETFIIAEAGVNHNGDLGLAGKLVVAARRAGADAVKFQSFKAEKLVSVAARKVGYQKKTVGQGTQFDMIKRLELDAAAHRYLVQVCRREKVLFLSTPFDEGSADLLESLNLSMFKIASGEVTNIPFLQYVARKKRPLMLSTGMSTLNEVREAVTAIIATGNKRLALLHCVTEYPAPFAELNLRAIQTLAKEFGLPVGLSDHSAGISMPCAAVALGAQIIEKHLTLDKAMPGPDHKASLEPGEFLEMVRAVRAVELALGSGIKKPAACELKYIPQVRRSVVALRDIARGQKISPADVGIKRPGCGIPPKDMHKVVGRKAIKDLRCDQPITWDKVR